jgi:hypothetical protein
MATAVGRIKEEDDEVIPYPCFLSDRWLQALFQIHDNRALRSGALSHHVLKLG